MSTKVINSREKLAENSGISPAIVIKRGEMPTVTREKLEMYIAHRRLEGKTLLIPDAALELIDKGLDAAKI